MNIEEIKKDFPILNRKINNHKLVYLDSAATSLKPTGVIKEVENFYSSHSANIHRGLYKLSEEASEMYDEARKKVAGFINASHTEEIIFTKGTTDSLNIVADSWGSQNIKNGDKILMTDFEHHSNLLPWMQLAKKVGATLEFVPATDEGLFNLEQFKRLLTPDVKLVAISHASNVLGVITPVKEISKLAHENGALVCVDGAQAVPHLKVNVQDLNCDFYAFSGHKMMGPMGIGVLYAKKKILEETEPVEFGGGMIYEVSYENATWTDLPEKFEAGTPNVSGAVGLGTAVGYLSEIGLEKIREHEIKLNTYLLEKLQKIKDVKIIGPLDPKLRTGLVSFYFGAKRGRNVAHFENIHAHDVSSVLDNFGIAVRSGHHCVMPYHEKHKIAASVRASYYIYNDTKDLDALVEGLEKSISIFGK